MTTDLSIQGFSGGSVVESASSNVVDTGDASLPGSEDPVKEEWQSAPGFFCLENPMEKGDCRATVRESQRGRHTWSS